MSDEKDYQTLRKLLLAPEQQALDAIRDNIEQSRSNKVNDVADVLSDSLRLSTKNDKTLSHSLQPAVESCIQHSVKQNPKFFANILFPIMGPAIRKSIAGALKEVVDSINLAMEQSFSKSALKWRWQSFTTGKSYGEIVLKNTLLFRVDQVFLINRQSGLLMQYVSHPDWQKGKNKMDSDAISAMLTAIQDFMHDSFNVEESDRLDSIDMGDSTVLLSHGPKATLACKVQGVVSHDVKNKMQEALEYLHLNHYRDMDEFDGDRRSMRVTAATLEGLLLEEKKQTSSKKQRSFFLSPFFFIFVLLLLGLLAWSVWAYLEKKKFDDYVTALDALQGIVVTSKGKQEGQYWIKGLQDPIALIGVVLLPDGIDAAKVNYQFDAYQSLEPDIVYQRALRLLKVPTSIKTVYQNNTLFFSGDISDGDTQELAWYNSIIQNSIYLAGIDKIDISQLNIRRTLGSFLSTHQQLIDNINKTVFYFTRSAELQEGEESKFIPLLKYLQGLDTILSKTPWTYIIKLTGYSDISGGTERNRIVRLARANYVKNYIAGKEAFNIEATAFDGQLFRASEIDYTNRKVTLQVIIQ